MDEQEQNDKQEDQPQPDHWGALVENLGAKPLEAPPRKVETPAPADDKSDEEVAVSDRPVLSARPRSDWSSLAKSLGVLPPPEPEVDSAAETETESTVEDGPPEPAADGEFGFGISEVQSGKEELESEPPEKEQKEEKEPEVKARPRRGRARPIEEEDAKEEYPAQAERLAASVEFESEGTACEAEAHLEPAAPGAADSEARKTAEADAGETTSETEDTGSADMVEDISDPSETEAAKPSRPRRRRGRRRSRTREDTETAEKPNESAANEETAQGQPADEKQEKSHGDESKPDKKPDERRRLVHRNIPTWEEAIGTIVNKNIESRKHTTKVGSGRPDRRSRGGGKRPRK